MFVDDRMEVGARRRVELGGDLRVVVVHVLDGGERSRQADRDLLPAKLRSRMATSV